MNKYRFIDDYSEGAHPAILESLVETNLDQQPPYGEDQYTERAKHLIRKQFRNREIPIHFVTSGTMANITIAAAALRSHESIIAAETGHIVANEAGAIEATGHQVITVAGIDGKLSPQAIESALVNNARFPHTTKPRIVYLSNATELGTVYDRDELRALRDTCRCNELLIWLDGARLGTAIAGPREFTLQDAGEFCDVIWIGGTKAGALFGEAIVIPNDDIAAEFAFHQKQRGALLSKGRSLGLQFATLFEDALFFDMARHACDMAQQLSSAIVGAGHELFVPTQSNMVFAVLPDELIDKLQKEFDLYVWKKGGSAASHVRLVTSWATEEQQVHRFVECVDAA